MFFSSAALGLALASSAVAKIINVDVGLNGLNYSPEAVFADPGDQVVLTFHPANHTFTRSSLADPCSPLSDEEGGIDSGFMPVAANQTDGFPTFTVDVTDHEPIWGYCRQAANTPKSHCGAGMVFAINCGLDGAPNSFANFKKAALKIGESLQANASSSASSESATASSAAATYDTAVWTTADYGTATIPVAPPSSVRTDTVTLDSAIWTTTWTSESGAAAPTPSSLTGNVIKIVVGGLNGELTFSPNNIQARPRDVLSFEFHAKNHTASQSSFSAPCAPLKDATSGQAIGFDSGFMPVDANATTFPVWNVTVNDTNTIWVYCKQHKPDGSSHCGAGMLFAANAVEDSLRNFSAWVHLASQLNGTNATGATGTGNSTDTNGNSNGANAGSAFNAVFSLGAVFFAAAVLL